MGLNGFDDLGNGDGGGKMATASSVSCSICLDAVIDNGDRSSAKLQCGHQFHLDCIGSAFNAKGAMQCPNCRRVEKGQWLYANGCRSLPEFHVDDWAPDDDQYDMGYSEMSFGVHWCPFSGLTRLPSSFEEGEFSSGAYHDIGQQAIISEHTSISSAGHPCPYMAYVGPIHPLPSITSGSISEGSNFSNNWNSPVTNEMPSSYTFPGMDVHYRSWEHHSSTLPMNNHSGSDQTSIPLVRVARTNYEIPRSGSLVHPFILAPRAGSSVASPMFPPHPGSVARARDRVQALQAYFQQPSTSLAVRTPVLAGTRRSSSHRGLSQVGPVGSSSDQSGGFYFFPPGSSGGISQDVENLTHNQYHAWEHEHLPPSFSTSQVNRDSGYGPFHQATTASVPDTGTRSSSSRHRHGTERSPSRNW